MNKRLISSELRRGFTGYGFWLALLIGCAIAVWHGCCMEGRRWAFLMQEMLFIGTKK